MGSVELAVVMKKTRERSKGMSRGHVEVVVAKGAVLGGVEDLQQGGGGVAVEAAAELVDLVEHEQRVVDAGAADGLDDAPWHGAHVRAPVAAQLGLVVHAAEAETLELAADRSCDGLADGGLADARRPHEAEDRGVGLRVEFHDRQFLDDAVLDLVEVVVILV